MVAEHWAALNGVWLTTVFLLSIRLSALLLMTPIILTNAVPATIRILIVFALAAALAIALPEVREPVALSFPVLIQAVFFEFAMGMTLALGIFVAFAAFSLAGRILDIQVGYGIGQVFDPITVAQVPILTVAFNQMAVVLFFLVNGHHALLRGLVYSLRVFPLGRPWSVTETSGPILKQVAALFSMGFALAAPVIFCLFLVEIALGVVSRNLPQLNMFAMEIPVKIVVGLAALALWYSGIGGVMSQVYASIFNGWNGFFSMASVGGEH